MFVFNRQPAAKKKYKPKELSSNSKASFLTPKHIVTPPPSKTAWRTDQF